MLLMLIAVACVKFDEPTGSKITVDAPDILYAEFGEEDMRTYLEQDKYLRWSAGDEISFFPVTSNVRYRFMGETGANSGVFEEVTSGAISGDALDNCYAVYPYAEGTTISSDGVISFMLPAVQYYQPSSFGLGANTMVAVTANADDNVLRFKNACGYLKLKLYADNATVKSIELKGNKGEKLAGSATITAEYGANPVVTMSSGATTAIKLDCGNGVKLSSNADQPTTFLFVIPTITFAEGFTMSVTDVDGKVYEKATKKEFAIERNMIQPMAALKAEFKATKPANNEIWYTTTDGNKLDLKDDRIGATITSHEQRDGVWVVTFGSDLTALGKEFATFGAFEGCTTLTSITIPDSVTTLYQYAFYGCSSLASVTLSTNLEQIDYQSFVGCTSLTEITIPASVQSFGDSVFYDCSNLATVTCLATTPPTLSDDVVFPKSVTIRVPDSALEAYLQDSLWNDYTIVTLSGEGGGQTTYEPNDPNYISSDYSANGTYVALQTAQEGNGIDVVFMGDGYSDRQIVSGRYEADMRKAMEAFFSKEPYASFRNLFNVYMVYLVSKREGCSQDYAYGETALNCKVKSDGVSVDGDTGEVYSYAKEIFGEQEYEYNDGPRIDESTLIVIMNSTLYAGVCEMATPRRSDNQAYDFGNGASLSFFSLCGDDALFANVLIHEACGHGFAKLADEYFSSGGGAMTEKEYYAMKLYLEPLGWYRNVDATIGDELTTESVKWKHFLSDSRYSGLVGLYEGALGFATNAYRPTDDSIMQHVRGSSGEFNAPSREAIYYRIHKLAYGTSWSYNFEDFATWDAKNR